MLASSELKRPRGSASTTSTQLLLRQGGELNRTRTPTSHASEPVEEPLPLPPDLLRQIPLSASGKWIPDGRRLSGGAIHFSTSPRSGESECNVRRVTVGSVATSGSCGGRVRETGGVISVSTFDQL